MSAPFKHFTYVNSAEIFESLAHEDNGVALGYVDYYRVGCCVDDFIVRRNLPDMFQADCSRNRWLYDMFCQRTGCNPEYIRFVRESGEMRVRAVFF